MKLKFLTKLSLVEIVHYNKMIMYLRLYILIETGIKFPLKIMSDGFYVILFKPPKLNIY